MHSTTVVAISPSFTSHSSTNLADVAARVVEEFRHENGDDYDDIFNFDGYDHDYDYNQFAVPTDDKSDTNTPPEKLKDENSDTDDDEFEFAVVSSDVNSSSISDEEIVSRGHMSHRYPLFDRSLLLDVDPNLIKVVNGSEETDCEKRSLVVRLPLRKLFSEERDFLSWSSSEADDLDGVSPGTYCVWKPKAESPGKCKKSNSTGNPSRRWKFRDILYRSNSDSKVSSFLLFKPLISTNKKINDEKVKKIEKSAKVASAVGDSGSVVAPKEKNPANKAENGGSRRRLYLPSRQALVGAFTNVSRSNRNLSPF